MLVLLQLPLIIYNNYNVLDVGRIVHVITVPAAVYLLWFNYCDGTYYSW